MTANVKLPNALHPITVEPTGARVIVRAGETMIADSTRALSLREASYPVVLYVPIEDVDPAVLRPSATSTHCPFKGNASYYDLVTPDGDLTDALWSYPQPYPAVREIAGHVAFYPDRVQISVEDAA